MNTPARNAKNANKNAKNARNANANKNACNINIEKTPFGTVNYSELEKILGLEKQGPGPVAQSSINTAKLTFVNINAHLGNPDLNDKGYQQFLESINNT